jgi:serine protease Do
MDYKLSRPLKGTFAALIAAGVIGVLMLGAPMSGAAAQKVKGENLSDKVVPSLSGKRLANGAPLSFADLVETVSPAVVSVSVEREVPRQMRDFSQQFRNMPESFRRRFAPEGGPGGEGAPPPMARSAGSGFIIDATGYIVTNNHVIDGGTENATTKITITMSDGTTLDAKLIGRDPGTDIALLKVEAKQDLPYVPFASDDNLRVGDWVIAVGNPFGLGGSVTAGIVSARGREMGRLESTYTDFIQIDASINRGNSGGPTFDLNGKVVGINTLIISPSGGNVGIGFAIPANVASDIVDQLKNRGEIVRGYLGVNIQLITEDIAEGMNLESVDGALVAEVAEDSPAEKAGFMSGDVILQVDGKPAKDFRHVTRMVGQLEPGQKIPFKIIREGKNKTIKVKIGKREQPVTLAPEEPEEEAAMALGLRLGEVTDDARQRLQADDKLEGVLITEISPVSEAAQKGLRPGDVILRVGNATVRTPSEVSSAIDTARNAKQKSVLFFVQTRQARRFVALKLAAEKE